MAMLAHLRCSFRTRLHWDAEEPEDERGHCGILSTGSGQVGRITDARLVSYVGALIA
jgi:hypothetical protein